MSYWTFGNTGTLIAIGFLVWCFSAYLCYQNWSRRRKGSIAFLESIRLIIITGLILTLFKPEHVRIIEETEPPAVVVLSDHSGSMETLDINAKTNVLSRSAWLEQELSKEYWNALNVGSVMHMRVFSSTAETEDTDGTDIDAALKEVLQQQIKEVIMSSGSNPVDSIAISDQ